MGNFKILSLHLSSLPFGIIDGLIEIIYVMAKNLTRWSRPQAGEYSLSTAMSPLEASSMNDSP